MFTKSLVSLLIFAAGALPASADEYYAAPLVEIYNDRDANHVDIDLVLDGTGFAQGVSYLNPTSGLKRFTLAQLQAGAVLEEQQGVKALILIGNVDSTAGSGRWSIKFINNGLSGVYKTCAVNLKRAPDGMWQLIHSQTGAVIRTAKIISWSLGITTIEGICPK